MIKKKKQTNASNTNQSFMVSFRMPIESKEDIESLILDRKTSKTEFFKKIVDREINFNFESKSVIKGVTYQCASCMLVIPVVCYVRDSTKASGHKSYCKNCTAIKNAKK